MPAARSCAQLRMELAQVGKYKIVGRIGQGAMGEVYKAQDPVLNRFVAVKTISASLGSDEQHRKRFQREAQSVAQLNHPNIVTVFEFAEERGQIYLVMELLDGKDLKHIIARRALGTLDDKLAIIDQVLSGLAFAHGRGVIHRDLKPANIHVLGNGTAKILDFGLARLGVSEMTRTGTVMGTPNYMSPEQVRAEQVDGRSDLFSVGAVFYEVLAGRKSFDAEGVHAILYEVLERDPPPLQDLVPGLPRQVAEIVGRGLAKDPAGRFQSAGEMREAVRAARRALASSEAAVAALSGGQAEETIVGAETGTMVDRGASTSTGMSSGYRQATLVSGATALDLAQSSEPSLPGTERPATLAADVTMVGAPPRRGILVMAALAAAIVVAAVGWRVLQRRVAPAPPAFDVAREQGLRDVLISSQVELAQADLDNKDYAGAAQRAQQVLKLDKGNAEANDILARANERRAALETAAQEATTALASGDTEGASRALSRVLAIDPRHPVVAELSASLNSHFSAEAEQARKAAAEARVQAETAKAAASQPFQAADRLVQEGQTLLGGAQYAEATQKFLEAGITFDRARRAAEAAAAAQARSTAPPPTAPAERVSAAPATPGTAVVSSATLAPPPQTVPSRPSFAPALPAAPPAPTVQETAASAEQAVRRVISDYGRALETKDLDLFRNVKPNLSGDEEKRLRESFRAVKSHEVGISVDSVQIDGSRAVVRVSRQDTINGNAMKPLQQTFHLLSRDGAWAIESIGQ